MYVMCLYLPQSIPYNNTIPGGLREGMALYIQGVALASREV